MPRALARHYADYQKEVGPPGYRAVPGNRGILMLGRESGPHYEIAMLTMWDNWKAIQEFSGSPVDRARYYERDFDFLIDPPEKVEHFEVKATRGGAAQTRAVRLWRGTVEASQGEKALGIAVATVDSAYRRIACIHGYYLLARQLEDILEIGLLTLWDSFGSQREFAVESVGGTLDRDRKILPWVGDDWIGRAASVDRFDVLEAENFEA